MLLKLTGEIPLQEICRQMGHPAAAELPLSTRVLAEEAWRKVTHAAQPRMVWRRLELKWPQGRPSPCACVELPGEDIARHLAGCDGVVLLAVTLGSGIDSLLRRLCTGAMEEAMAADAAASILAEQAAEAAEQAVRGALPAGRWLTGRFSPGYGDLPLEVNGALAAAVNARRAIGLAVTENGLLMPRKSVAALLGEAGHPVTGRPAGCAHCALRNSCAYRKEGKSCAN